MPSARARVRELVLVGAGHAHVQVLRAFGMRPPADTHLTLVVDRPVAVYSGMVPGLVAGQYRPHELEIDSRPLARRARARVIVARALAVDARVRRIELAGRPPVRYDLASLDVGSTVAGLDVPGAGAHALPTRPISAFVRRVPELIERARASGGRPFRYVVVGGGAGGVELWLTLAARLEAAGIARVEGTLLEAGARILPGQPRALAARALRIGRRRGLAVRCGARVVSVDAGAVSLESGEKLGADAILWVTGAVGTSLVQDSELPRDARGFVRIRSTLQVEGCDDLFAVGDCAAPGEHPDLPKAGVYAVRQGPVLTRNLRAALAGRPLRRYVPQSDFLALLNAGDGRALGAKWGRAFEGRAAFRLKDWIDRRFMRRFQVLDARGAPNTRAFPPMPGMEDAECGGCAAKLGPPELARALERVGVPGDRAVRLGLREADDAALFESPGGELVAASIDAFRAFTDDPWLVGRVAAVNALGDLYAKGATPRFALALVQLPGDDPERSEEDLFQVLAGARAALDPLGVTLVGGHTSRADAGANAGDLAVGFAVTGFLEPGREPLTKSGLRAGDALVLTKPLGTGVLFHADMRGRAAGAWIESAIASMVRPNAEAARVARAHGVVAATDVTGFGVAVHLAEMLRASGVSAELELARIPALPGAATLLARGERSTAHAANRRAAAGSLDPGSPLSDPATGLLFDPQTSGGLLLGVPSARLPALRAALARAGVCDAAPIGRVVAARSSRESPRLVLRSAGAGPV